MRRREPERRLLPAGLLAFSLTQLLTLSPALTPSALYGPQLLLTPTGVPMLIGLALACGLLLQAGAGLVGIATRRHGGWGRRIGVGSLVLLVLALQGASAYYTRFGSYPNLLIVRDFLAAPAVFLAYTASDIAPRDVATYLFATIAVIVLTYRGARQVWGSARPWVGVVGSVVTGFLILAALHAAPAGRQHTFLVAEHSLPAVKYLLSLTGGTSGNRVEVFQPIMPRAVAESAPVTFPRARHVLVVVAEALRADHLPAYGYRRDTTPYLTSEQGRWIAFRRAYAHGSRTADSFPVIFNSRYFAAVDRTNRGARDLWTSLRAANVRTAFLSAGAIEWGGVMAAIAFKSIDEGLIASDFPAEHRRDVTRLPFDYAVDDALPLDKYRTLMAGDFGRGASLATLHLVGSHYPFNYADAGDVFVPNLRESRASADGDGAARRLQYYDGERDLTGGRLSEIANSYDNGIRHIDRLVQRAVEILAALDILEDSVIIVTSDHGEALGEHRTLFHGTTLYEEQVHVPLLVRVGSHLDRVGAALTARAGDVAGLVDLMPTVHQLATGSTSQPDTFQGVSWLRSSRKPYELLLFRGIGEMAGVVTGDRKFIFDVTGRRPEEYDLAADPAERRNLWSGSEDNAAGFIDVLRRRGVL